MTEVSNFPVWARLLLHKRVTRRWTLQADPSETLVVVIFLVFLRVPAFDVSLQPRKRSVAFAAVSAEVRSPFVVLYDGMSLQIVSNPKHCAAVPAQKIGDCVGAIGR